MKKPNKIAPVAAVFLLCVSFQFASCQSGHEQSNKTTSDSTSVPAAPDQAIANPNKTLYVYSMRDTVAVRQSQFPELVRKIAGNAFTGLKQTQTPGGLRFSSADASEYYEVEEAKGRFSFSRNLSRYGGDFRPQLPDSQKAREIAQSFLTTNKLMAEDPSEMRLIHSGGMRADDNNGKVIDKLVTLTYGRVIDNTPVVGSGSKIVVNVGDRGAVEGVIRNWKSIRTRKALSPQDIKGSEEMEKQLREQMVSEFGKETSMKIRRGYVVYFDNGGRFLQPVMAYETMISFPGKQGVAQEIPYLGIVEVMRKPAEELNLLRLDPKSLERINRTPPKPDQKPTQTDKSD